MALKTLDAGVKQHFTNAGINLTPEQEHVAAEKAASGFDWAGLIGKLANLAAQIIPIIIGLFGGQTPPAPHAQKQGGCPCDHAGCCRKTFESAVQTARLAGEHLCACCCS